MRKRLFIGLLGAVWFAASTAAETSVDDYVEIGGKLQEWNHSANYIAIGDERYRTAEGFSIVSDEGTLLSGSALRGDPDVVAYIVEGLVTKVVILTKGADIQPH